MKNFFIDTNIIIDVVNHRLPFYNSSAKILNYASDKKINLFISALSYSNIYYIARKSISHQQCIAMMKDLTILISTIDVTKEIIDFATHSDFKDFDDAIQYFTAKSHKNIDAIVTRNLKDFKLSDIPLLLPDDITI